MTKIARFDAAEFLDSEEAIAAYFSAALEDPNPDVFLTAVVDVAKVRGMSQLALDSSVGAGTSPSFAVVVSLLGVMGIVLQAKPNVSKEDGAKDARQGCR
ncbi:putative transcriptional regulator [Desulfovibrio sp. A2]|nr:putative transcriptional regulator [Desulfovibrio sp. A2]